MLQSLGRTGSKSSYPFLLHEAVIPHLSMERCRLRREPAPCQQQKRAGHDWLTSVEPLYCFRAAGSSASFTTRVSPPRANATEGSALCTILKRSRKEQRFCGVRYHSLEELAEPELWGLTSGPRPLVRNRDHPAGRRCWVKGVIALVDSVGWREEIEVWTVLY